MALLITNVDIGHTIYSAERVHGGSEEPLGGVVVEHWDIQAEERSIGERHYLVLDHRRIRPDLRFDTLSESEVGDTESSPPQRLRILVRRLSEEVCMDGFKRRQGAMSAREADCVRWAWALLRSMGGPDG